MRATAFAAGFPAGLGTGCGIAGAVADGARTDPTTAGLAAVFLKNRCEDGFGFDSTRALTLVALFAGDAILDWYRSLSS